MNYFEIGKVKEFTAQLFAGSAFDGYLVSEVLISTAATFTIDGHVNESFVGEEEMKSAPYREGLVPWQRIRPVCYEIIKGRKVPSKFRIVLRLPEQMLDQFLLETSLQRLKEQINGLFLNIRFQNQQLSCTTGTSLKTFSMDKSLEGLWDEYAKKLLLQYL